MRPHNSHRITGDTQQAVEALKQDQVVALPTETVYGLGARIFSTKAVEKVFQIKSRPFFDPLIVHVSDIAQAKSYTEEWSEVAQKLAENFWPGPLTLVLKKHKRISDLITSGHPSVGLRMPRHPLTQKIIADLGEGLAAPSANRFGRLSPTSVNDVLAEFPNDEFLIVDGGDCEIGIESTVVQIQDDQVQILRPGLIDFSTIEKCLAENRKAQKIHLSIKESELSPGHLENHYQPDIPLVFFARTANERFVPRFISSELQKLSFLKVERTKELRLPENPNLAARSLYSELRRLANSGAEAIYFIEPDTFAADEWLAIRNRLLKASSHLVNQGKI